jgi:hypothetical protein
MWDDLETHSVPYTIIHVDGKVVGHWIGYFSAPDIENMLMGNEREMDFATDSPAQLITSSAILAALQPRHSERRIVR